MGWEEAVVTGRHAAHHIDGILDDGIVAGPRTGHKGFHHQVGDSCRDEYAGSRTTHGEQYLCHGLVVLEHHIEQGDVKGNPRNTRRQCAHHTIGEQRVTAVQPEQ